MIRKIAVVVVALLAVLSLAACEEDTKAKNESAPEEPVGDPPAAPEGISALAADSQVTVAWEAVDEATSYNLYSSTDAGIEAGTGTLVEEATSPYVHEGLDNGTVYYYVVTALNDDGESNPSGIASATPSGVFLNETFADNSAGWTLENEWEIGAAVAGCNDPGTDNTPTDDNGVAGIVIGGCYAITPTPSDFEYLTSPVIDTTSFSGTSLELNFQRWLQSDYPSSFAQNQVEVFDGAAWIVVWVQPDGTDPNDVAWSNQVFDITALSNANLQVRFGFRLLGNSGVYADGGWNVDDVVIQSIP